MPPVRLMLLPFLQRWDGATLSLRLLVTPQTDPLAPMAAGEPAFVDAGFGFELRAVADLSGVPTLSSPFTAFTFPRPVPQKARAIAEDLKARLPIDETIGPVDARSASVRFMKYAPPPYCAATGYRGGTNPFLLTDESYHCALKAPIPPGTSIKTEPPKLPWGRVLAQALRQPPLAEALGMVYPLDLDVEPDDLLRDGGWIYVTLGVGSPGASLLGASGAVRLYAARLPPLGAPRALFTPVLFPVAALPPPGVAYDTLFREAIDYDDGFAKAIYARQPIQANPLDEADGERPQDDLGVQLGWDDEQVVTWFNRQVDPGATSQDAPMGVLGYRVDARRPGGEWASLVMGKAALALGGAHLGDATAEFRVEIAPSRLFGDVGPNWWVPSYYTAWTGSSLAAQDPIAQAVRGLDATPATVEGVPPEIGLRYGEAYEFRVRLADMAGGGPALADDARNPGPQPEAPLRFLRWVKPRAPRLEARPPVEPVPDAPPASLVVRRPLLSYPAAVFAGGPRAAILADVAAAQADERAVGLPDPDTALLEITVQVESAGSGVADGYLTLLTTTRPFPATAGDPLTLAFEWRDLPDARALPAAASGPLLLPTSRRVRLVLTALCPERDNYYGASDVRRGASVTVTLRRNADDERALLRQTGADALQGVFLQPPAPPLRAVVVQQKAAGAGVAATSDPMGLLAAALDLDHKGTTLRARLGERLMIGCSPLLRHVTGPDGASVTFASAGDVVQVWVVALRLDLMRDWSWDGLDHLLIERDGQEVGRVEPRGLGGHEASGDTARDRSRVVFLDAIDPKPTPPAFPRPLSPSYRVTPVFRRAPTQADVPLDLAIRLPVTTAPAQIPRLVAAGMAMSPYERDPLYTRTEERTKRLWLEFDAPPADPMDSLCWRVLAYAPDPILADLADPLPEEQDPPLPQDPEPIRRIVPGQGEDSGARKMVPLLPTDSPVHFILPLPPGMTADSPELFGFFTYEFRYVHTGMWHTDQGGYGRPLRVTGVQHATPALRCAVTRSRSRIEVSASFAEAVVNSRSGRATPPATGLWALLYAQVHQADGTDRRNILLGTRQLKLDRRADKRGRPWVAATAVWSNAQVANALEELTLEHETPLSCLAVETLPGDAPWDDPLGGQLGYERFLRTSTLVAIPPLC